MASPTHRDLIMEAIARVRRDCDPAGLVAARCAGLDPPDLIVSVGKAAASMVRGLWMSLAADPADREGFEGPIVVPKGTPVPPEFEGSRFLFRAGHPLPDEDSLRAGEAIATAASTCSAIRAASAGEKPRAWVLLSGGASSLAIHPPPAISLQDYRAIVHALLLAGAPITDLNTVRKHIDSIKGGGLARRLSKFETRALVLSDVIGDDLSTIGSGPLTADPTTFADCLDILKRHDCLDASPAVLKWLQEGARGEHPETAKRGDPDCERIITEILANNATAVSSASAALTDLGIHNVQTRNRVTGEAEVMGRALADEAVKVSAAHGKTRALTWGGETTVNVGAATGKGGRNLEFALAAAIRLEGAITITLATFATDGVDGPTDAAGAIVTSQTCPQARSIDLNPADFLSRHDSFTFFEKLDRAGFPHLIKTGPTGTNVNDIAIAIVG